MFRNIYNNILVYINSYMFRASPAHRKGADVHVTIIGPYYHLQYAEMSEVHKFMLYRDGYVHRNWSSLWVRLCSQYRDYT